MGRVPSRLYYQSSCCSEPKSGYGSASPPPIKSIIYTATLIFSLESIAQGSSLLTQVRVNTGGKPQLQPLLQSRVNPNA
ncbi:hypothetical protein KQX54_014677 [Cotesia glomerata]|uniref:Uncharacterized protein n=1 Tax=Cotesia glomerata TaxID=32391 RepID=A0AAV7IUY2_COTGL|nr:hypothetical protein KQX54_014677 [Cotesia glomerata]